MSIKSVSSQIVCRDLWKEIRYLRIQKILMDLVPDFAGGEPLREISDVQLGMKTIDYARCGCNLDTLSASISKDPIVQEHFKASIWEASARIDTYWKTSQGEQSSLENPSK